MTSELLSYGEVNHPHIGKSATSASKVGKYADRPGEVSGEIRVVRTWYALGQEVWFILYCGTHFLSDLNNSIKGSPCLART